MLINLGKVSTSTRGGGSKVVPFDEGTGEDQFPD